MSPSEAKSFARSNTKVQKIGLVTQWICVFTNGVISAELDLIAQAMNEYRIGFLKLRNTHVFIGRGTEEKRLEDLAEARRKMNFFQERIDTEPDNDPEDSSRFGQGRHEKWQALVKQEKNAVTYLENTDTKDSLKALGEGFTESLLSGLKSQNLDVLVFQNIARNEKGDEEESYYNNKFYPLFVADSIGKLIKQVPKAIGLKIRKVKIKREELTNFVQGIDDYAGDLQRGGNNFIYCYNPKKTEEMKEAYAKGELFLPLGLKNMKGAGTVSVPLEGVNRIFAAGEKFYNVGRLGDSLNPSKTFGVPENGDILGHSFDAKSASLRSLRQLYDASATINLVSQTDNYQRFRDSITEILLKLEDLSEDLKKVPKSLDDALLNQKELAEQRQEVLGMYNKAMEVGRGKFEQTKNWTADFSQEIIKNPRSVFASPEAEKEFFKKEPLWNKGFFGLSNDEGIIEYLEKHKDVLEDPMFAEYVKYTIDDDPDVRNTAPSEVMDAMYEDQVLLYGKSANYQDVLERVKFLTMIRTQMESEKMLLESSPTTEAEAEAFANSIEIKPIKSLQGTDELKRIEFIIRTGLKKFYRMVDGNISTKRFKRVVVKGASFRAHADETQQQICVASTDCLSTVYHELFHFLEYENEDIHKAAQVFLLSKITSLRVRTLNYVDKKEKGYGGGWRKDEKAYETGRSVSTSYLAKTYGQYRNASEAITMMCQDLLIGPHTFYRNMVVQARKFPDELIFAYGMIEGFRNGTFGKSRMDAEGKNAEVIKEQALRKGYMPRGFLLERSSTNFYVVTRSNRDGQTYRQEMKVGEPIELQGNEDIRPNEHNDLVCMHVSVVNNSILIYLDGPEFNRTNNRRRLDRILKPTRFYWDSDIGAYSDGRQTYANSYIFLNADVRKVAMEVAKATSKTVMLVRDQGTADERWFISDVKDSKDWKVLTETEFPLSQRFDSDSPNMRK